MGKIQEFTIKVNENAGHYIVSPDGRLTVTGYIVLVLNKAVQVRYLKLSFIGVSECNWTTGSGDNEQTHSSYDELFKRKSIIIQSTETAPAILDAGAHSFPFHYEIRSSRHLPSSYTGNSGRIEYNLRAKMDRFGIVFDDKAALSIILWNPIQTDMRAGMEPVEREEEHTDCCLCCASGPVIVHANFNKSAIRLGSDDSINMSLSVTNMKRDSVIPRACLQEFTTFRAGASYTYSTKKVLQVEANVIARQTRSNQVTLTLGPIIEPVCGNIDSTGNIRVEYQIVLRMKGSRLKLIQPIFIGLDNSSIPSMAGQAAGDEVNDPYPYRAFPPPVDYSDVHLYQTKPVNQ